MSGCCGPSPIITSLPPVPRVDVEGSLLCDVLADGTVAGQALVEAVYDTSSGDRVGTRTVDPATGAVYAPQGTLQPCPPPDSCTCETLLLCDVTTVTTPGETPERITNGTFAADASGWTLTGGAAYVPSASPDGSVGFLDLSANNNPAGTAEQTVTVTPGLTYDLSARIGIWSTGGVTPQSVLVEVVDGSGAVLYSQTVAPVEVSGGPQWPADGVVGPVSIVATDAEMTVRFTDQAGGQFIDALVDDVSLLGPGVPGATETVAVPFLRTLCRTCTGTATVTDTTLDGTTVYAVQGVVGVCGPTESPATEEGCDQFVGTLCYQQPTTADPSFTLHKFNPAEPNHPGCLVGLDAMDGDFPFIQYNDPVTAWEGTYTSNTGTASNVEVSAPELGGFIDWSAFSPPIPSVPNAGIPAPYTGTAVFNGVTVTLDVLTASAITTGTQYLRMGGTEHFKLSFSSPVTMKFATQGFADPAPGNDERFCGVVATGVVTGAGEIRTAYGLRDCTTGETTWRDQVSGDTVDLTQAVVVPCPQPQRDCASPTEPTATVGLCLADGTPIAVTVIRDCAGTVTSEGWLNLVTGAYSAGAPPAGTVACGDSRSIQVSGTFCAVDDATGDVVALVLIEYHYDDTGAIASVRLVDAVTGATYTPPAGVTVTTCPAGVEQPEQDAVILCDVQADGTAVQFVRDYRRDELGAIVGHTDYLLDGTPYPAPTGTVGVCATPCRTTSSEVLCDSTPLEFDPAAVTLRVANPADTSATTQYPGHRWRDAARAAVQTVLDGGSASWGTTGLLDDTANPDHFVWGGFGFTLPDCPPCGSWDEAGDVTLNMSVRVTNNGPAAGVADDGVFALFNGTTWIGQQALPAGLPSGGSATLTFTPTVHAVADLPNVVAVLALELKQGANTAKTWTVDALTYSLTPVAGSATGTAGCGKQFLRTYVRDCATGALIDTVDQDFDGATYAVVGDVAQCTPHTGCADTETCSNCETLLLCDGSSDPAMITGNVASGTLANGVTWSATTTSGTQANPANFTNSDGAWWGLHVFPVANVAPTKWNFSRPVVAEFSVYLHYNAVNTALNTAQLPTGLEIVHLPTGYTYNPVTGVLTRTADGTPADPCSYVTNPLADTSARFRTPGAVTTFTTAPAPNSRIALCGTFFNYWAGAVTVTPAGQFLRRICRDCDGNVTSVTDTELDAVTPYTPLGAVGQCADPRQCDTTVLSECDYSLPDTVGGFDTANASFPDCWLGTATNPGYAYGDRVTSWEGTYLSNTGTVSDIGFNSADLGGPISFAAFTPPLPAGTPSAPDYVGTAMINGVTVTLRVLAGNGVVLQGTTLLELSPQDRIGIEFSKPVRLTVATSAFADPPTPNMERLCGVVAERVPWTALRLADCDGVITTVDATTRVPLPATATVSCDDTCCQPVPVCVATTVTESVEFISNEQGRTDGTVDPVWKWSPTSPDDPAAVWYDMYQATYGATWSVTDGPTKADGSPNTRQAHWVAPHPNARTAQSSPPRANEGPTLNGPVSWWARASFDLPAAADPDSIRVEVTVLNSDQVSERFRLNDGAWQSLPASAKYDGTRYTFGPGQLAGAKPGTNTLYFQVRETLASDPTNGAGVIAHLIASYDIAQPGQRQWIQMVCCDDSSYYLDENGDRHEVLPDNTVIVPCGSGAVPLLLCDDAGPFLRHVVYQGEQIITSDTTLAGEPYAPVGAVTSCAGTGGTSGADVETVLLCDITTSGGDLQQYAPTSTAIVPSVSHGEPAQLFTNAGFMIDPSPLFPSGGSVVVPTWGTDPGGFRDNTISASVTSSAPTPCGTPANVRVTVSLRATNTGSATDLGSPEAGLTLRNGASIVNTFNVANTPTNAQQTFTVTAVVPWADLIAGNITWYWWARVYQTPNIHKSFNVDQYAVTIEDETVLPGCGETTAVPFLRHYTPDSAAGTAAFFDTTLTGATYAPTGDVGLCAGEGSTTTASGRQIVERCGCDQTPGGIVRYVELWSVDPEGIGAPLLVGTYLEGDFESPYAPVSPVDCPDDGTVAAPVLTGLVRPADTLPRNLSADFPGLQSVTLTVLAGNVAVTASSFGATVPAGTSLTWSALDGDAGALDGWSCTGQAGADYLLSWTYTA
ncbi:hypothetical protein [Streptomyces sp. SAI-127]|uniref:hypothetical protein n=1 Tax=Streptomyces sp. SAI-127 TaxID=2940543 RepID=UPI0024753C3C|nr:hypothetical protein [Streptomyces sp. SAI-127]MDH6489662.1 hypothetical protein [Streptomyces sp. SAI-127]